MNKNKDNFYNKITWLNLNKEGYINEFLKKGPVIYIFKIAINKTHYYVGSSINISSRLSTHRSRVIGWSKGNRSSASPIFYNHILKYGWNNFQLGVLEYTKISNKNINIKKTLLEREQYYLDTINPSLNVCKIANSPLGIKRDANFRFNLSKARRGKSYNVRTNVNIITKVNTPETILKLSARHAGVKVKLFDKANNLIKEFPTITSTAKFVGVSPRTINKILNTGLSYDDYIYKFEVIKGYPILIINKVDNSIKEYYSLSAAARDISVRRESISNYINTNKLLKGIFLITRQY